MTREGKEIFSGRDLVSLDHIDTMEINEAFQESHFTIACDVTNPLYGPNGAAAIYSPQKGATSEDVELLDNGLRKLAAVIMNETGIDLQKIPGTGAAGGLVVPFIAYTNSELKPGLDVVLDAVDFDNHLTDCDLVITGEGRTDYQSSMGKAISGIGKRSKDKGVPVIVISGALQKGCENLYQDGISALFSTCREVQTLDLALKNARVNLEKTAGDIFRLIKLGLT